jgi:Ca2+/Na+ antiporter
MTKNLFKNNWWGWQFGQTIVFLAYVSFIFSTALWMGEWYVASGLMLVSTYILFVYAYARIYAERNELFEMCQQSIQNTDAYRDLYQKEKKRK